MEFDVTGDDLGPMTIATSDALGNGEMCPTELRRSGHFSRRVGYHMFAERYIREPFVRWRGVCLKTGEIRPGRRRGLVAGDYRLKAWRVREIRFIWIIR